MKNKAILKRKQMEIFLYTPHIIQLGLEAILTQHTFTFKIYEKVFYITF